MTLHRRRDRSNGSFMTKLEVAFAAGFSAYLGAGFKAFSATFSEQKSIASTLRIAMGC